MVVRSKSRLSASNRDATHLGEAILLKGTAHAQDGEDTAFLNSYTYNFIFLNSMIQSTSDALSKNHTDQSVMRLILPTRRTTPR